MLLHTVGLKSIWIERQHKLAAVLKEEFEVWCELVVQAKTKLGSLNVIKTSESWIWKGTMRLCSVTVTPWQKGGGIALCKYGWSHLICCMQILHLLAEGFHYNLATLLDCWDFNLEILHSHFGIWESGLMLCLKWKRSIQIVGFVSTDSREKFKSMRWLMGPLLAATQRVYRCQQLPAVVASKILILISLEAAGPLFFYQFSTSLHICPSNGMFCSKIESKRTSSAHL